jgi:hypothetical protein
MMSDNARHATRRSDARLLLITPITFAAIEMPRAQAPAPGVPPLTGVDLVRSTHTNTWSCA